jgi:hypothetical protein
MRFFLHERGADIAVARALNLQRMDEPGIACWMPDGSILVVDGSHRLVKRVLQGCETMALWTCEEPVWSQSLVRHIGSTTIMPT